MSSFQRVLCTDFSEDISVIFFRLCVYRLERLLCQLDAQSPILSDAEIGMEQELSQLPVKLETMHYHIEEVSW